MVSASTSEKVAVFPGMPASQIRALIGCRDEDLVEVGQVIQEEPNRITETINRYKGRRNERIRLKLSAHLNISYQKLWGEEPLEKRANGKEEGVMPETLAQAGRRPTPEAVK